LISLLAFFTSKGKENVDGSERHQRSKKNGPFLYRSRNGKTPMMNAFTALLEARDPSLGRFRAYVLEAGTDLFGAWLVEITYGRIGTPGRRIRHVVANEAEAKKLVRENACRVVLSTTDIPPSLRGGAIVPVSAMPIDEATVGLSKWLEESGRTLQSWQQKKLLESFEGCGLPLYLRLAFEEARRWRSFDTPSDCALGEGVEGIIDRLFQRLADGASHGPVLASHVLGYLAAARYGLAEDEVLELLTRNDAVWQDVIGDSSRRHHDPPERRLPMIV
jgi:hypothetical protein